jgi:hypothetical protein
MFVYTLNPEELGDERRQAHCAALAILRRPDLEHLIHERHRPRDPDLLLMKIQIPPPQFGDLPEAQPTRPQHIPQRAVRSRRIGKRV